VELGDTALAAQLPAMRSPSTPALHLLHTIRWHNSLLAHPTANQAIRMPATAILAWIILITSVSRSGQQRISSAGFMIAKLYIPSQGFL